MLRGCNRGFTLVEVIISLSMLLVVCGLLLPPYVHLRREGENTEMMYQGNRILYEEILRYHNGGELNQEAKTVIKNGISYQLSWEVQAPPYKHKVCITWNNIREKHMKRCGYAKS